MIRISELLDDDLWGCGEQRFEDELDCTYASVAAVLTGGEEVELLVKGERLILCDRVAVLAGAGRKPRATTNLESMVRYLLRRALECIGEMKRENEFILARLEEEGKREGWEIEELKGRISFYERLTALLQNATIIVKGRKEKEVARFSAAALLNGGWTATGALG